MFGRKSYLLTTAVFAGSLVTAAYAADVKPAVVYDLGGKFDKSFNEGVFNGADQVQEGHRRRFPRPRNPERRAARAGPAQIRQGRIFADHDRRLRLGDGARKRLPPSSPNTKFGIIDDVVDKPNVQSIVFKEHEGSFLVGVIAAKTSKTGKVGFVGGMDIPLISKFGCGYAQGVKYVNDKDEVFANMTGTDFHCLERSGEGRRTRQVADRSRRGHRLRRRGRDRTGRAEGGRRRRQARHRRRLGSGQSVPRPCADLDAQARRRRDLQVVHGRQERHMEARARCFSVSRKAASTMRSTNGTRAC